MDVNETGERGVYSTLRIYERRLRGVKIVKTDLKYVYFRVLDPDALVDAGFLIPIKAFFI